MGDVIRGFRVSPQQRRSWLLGGVGPGFCASGTASVGGAVDPERIREAIDRLVARHEILRTTFERAGGLRVPVQRVRDTGEVDWGIEDLSAEDDAERREGLASVEARTRELPFDPSAGPVLRARLVRFGGDQWLVVALPSLCADRATLELLARELAESLAGDRRDGEDEEVLQYAQYAEWRWGVLEDPEAEEGRAHWRERVPGAATDARVPGERIAAEPTSFRPATVELALDARTSERLRTLAPHEDDGIAPALLAAWHGLLARLTGRADAAVGVVLDGRGYAELAGVAGPLAETLPLPLRAAPDRRFIDLVAAAGEALAEAGEWQEYYAAEDLLASDEPVPIPHAFEYQDLTPVPGAPMGLRWHTQVVHGDRFRLKLTCSDRNGGTVAALHFDRDAVEPATAERLLARFATLLGSAAEAPESPLRSLDLLPRDERRELLEELNRTGARRPKALFHELIEEQVDRVPDAVAAVQGDRHVTYGTLDRRANRLAHRLRELGVGPEDLVGVHLERSHDLLVALLGISKAGGAFLPLGPDEPPQRLARILETSRPRAVVSLDRRRLRSAAGGSALVRLDEEDALRRAGPDRLVPAAIPGSLAYVLHTSGSTGRPKGVMVPHAGIVNYLLWAVETYGVKDGDRVPVHSPLGFDLTLTSLLGPLVAGATVELLPDELGVDSLAQAIVSAPGFALVKLTPLHLGLLAEHLAPSGERAPVRTLVLGGEALDAGTLQRWWRGSPATVAFNEYGPTETVVGVSAFRAAAETSPESAVPIGRPIANARLYLVDRWGEPAPMGVSGELRVGGVCVARGYLGRPAETADRFLPDPFASEPGGRLYRTGDLASYGPDRQLRYLGRTDHQLKVRGVRVEPAEVEAALEEHPAVRDAVVKGWEDPSGDLRLVAYLLTDDASAPDAEEIRSFLLDRLPEPMSPTTFVWMERFPETPNGKVDRAKLPPPGTRRPDLKGAYVPPRTALEEVLAEIWAEVLDVDRVGVEDSFFALGGDSIRSVRVVAAAQERGLEFTVQDLFRHQTVARLGEHLEASLSGAPVDPGDDAELASLVEEVEGLTAEEVRRRLRSHWESEDRAS